MSLAQVRGGIPHVFRLSVPTAGQAHSLPFSCFYLVARNQGANVIRLYFTEADFTANANYIVLPVAAAITPQGEWAGPVEAKQVWLRAITAASDIELVAFQRRG